MTHAMNGSAVTRWLACSPAGAISGTPTIMAARPAASVTPALSQSEGSGVSSSAARAAGAPSASSAAGASAS